MNTKSILLLILFSFINLLEISTNILKIGTCGDYKPVTFLNKTTGEYEGLEIELIEIYAKEKNYSIEYIKTTWSTLMNDTLENKFDLAIGGITITENRLQNCIMSIGYLKTGKTFLMRKEDINKYKSISDVNKNNVRVMINPGGTNEKFAKENLTNANLIIHNINEEIPEKISKNEADIMVTEIMEGLIYVNEINNLDVPLYKNPFTDEDIGILMKKDKNILMNEINKWLKIKIEDGTIDNLKKKYIPYPNNINYNLVNFELILILFLMLI